VDGSTTKKIGICPETSLANRSLGALNRIRTSAQGAPSSSGDSDRPWQLLRRGVIVALPLLVTYVAVQCEFAVRLTVGGRSGAARHERFRMDAST
jgi:hypothetical protein